MNYNPFGNDDEFDALQELEESVQNENRMQDELDIENEMLAELQSESQSSVKRNLFPPHPNHKELNEDLNDLIMDIDEDEDLMEPKTKRSKLENDMSEVYKIAAKYGMNFNNSNEDSLPTIGDSELDIAHRK